MNTILRVYDNDNNKYDLDLFQDVEFTLSISAKEAGEIPSIFGIQSQQVTLPATNTNNDYFGNLWDLAAVGNTSFVQTFPCQVLENGDEVFTGKIYLESIVTDQYGDTVYNVVIFDEVVDFKFQIENLTWKDVFAYFNVSGSGTNLQAGWNHPYTFTNISSSWDLALPANPTITQPNIYLPRPGDVVYPLAEYGTKENSLDSLVSSGGTYGTFTNYDTPIRIDQFKPAIRVNAMFKALMRYTGYQYSSSFFDSNYFDTVYYLTTATAEQGAVTSLSPTASFLANKDGYADQNIINSSVSSLIFTPNELYDNGAGFDDTTSQFTAQLTGAYSFQAAILYSVNNPVSPSPTRRATIDLQINGIKNIAKPVIYDLTGKAAGTMTANWPSVSINAGDIVELTISFTSTSGAETLKIFGTNATYFQCYAGPASSIGQQVDFSLAFGDEKVSDWLRGLIQKFNLVIEPFKDNKTLLRIEPFEEWRAIGQVVDWTDKVDRNVKFEIKHPLQSQPKNVYFSDEEDTDDFNKYSIDNLDKVFGDYTYVSDTDIAEGENRVGTFFAPTPMKYIPGTTDFIVPQIYTVNNGSIRPLKFKPRLLHYVGLKNSTSLTGENGLAQTSGEWYFVDESLTTNTLTQHPVFHHISQLPADPNWNSNNNPSTTLDLHFGNLNHWEYHQDYVDAQTYRGAYYEYWAQYLNELYDVDSRLVTLNVKLNPVDISQIQLNDKIFIDGAYYRINKIPAASLTVEQSTEVELLKAGTRRNPFPRRRVIKLPGSGGGTGGSTGGGGGVTTDQEYFEDIIIGEVNGGGKVVYNNYDTGVEVTDYNLIQQAAGKDGVAASPSGTFWENIETPTPTTNFNLGNNYVDNRNAYNVTIGYNNDLLSSGGTNVVLGENNTLTTFNGTNMVVAYSASVSDVENASVFYPTRDITSDNYNDTLSTGQLIVQSGFAPEYNVVTQYAGNNVYITSSNSQYPFYLFDWSGSLGDSYLRLPDANDLDGIEFRFQLSSSFVAGTGVEVYPSGSQKINGSNFITLGITGSTYEIKAISGSWITNNQVINTSYIPTQPLAYGSFYSTSSQTLLTASVSQSVTIGQTYLANGTSTTGSKIYIDTAGIYEFSYIAQVQNTDNAVHDAVFWIKYNGTDYPQSTTYMSLQPRKSSGEPNYQLMTANFIGQAQNDNDYIELYWTADSTTLSLFATGSGVINGEPATPSVIANIKSVR